MLNHQFRSEANTGSLVAKENILSCCLANLFTYWATIEYKLSCTDVPKHHNPIETEENVDFFSLEKQMIKMISDACHDAIASTL